MFHRLENDEKEEHKGEQENAALAKEMLDTRTIVIAEEISPELSRRV